MLIVLTMGAYIADFFTNGKVTALFELSPAVLVKEMELWRIFTFPFAQGSAEGILLFFFTSWLIAPKLEDIFNKWLFPVLFVLLIALQGTISALIFWNSSIVIAGMEGYSFFVLTLFSLIYLDKKISFFRSKPFRSLLVTMFLALSWGTAIFIHTLFDSSMLIMTSASHLLFGIITATVIYFQMHFVRKMHIRRIQKELHDFKFPNPEELSMAIMAKRNLKKINQKVPVREIPDEKEDFAISEDKLNEILDKINMQGAESLTPDEMEYLKYYSDNI